MRHRISPLVAALLTSALLAACGSEEASDGDKTASTAIDCKGAEIPGVTGCADPKRYETDLLAVTGPRGQDTPHHAAVRELIEDRLKELGYTVELQAYGEGINVLASKKGSKAADEVVIVGAHYDGVPDCPAADDNATGVAGVLEVARLLATLSPERTLLFAFWDEEERGLRGAAHHAMALRAAGTKVVTVFDLETVGYFSKLPDSQQIPPGFDYVFPIIKTMMAENGKAGDFITLVYDTASAAAIGAFSTAAKTLGLPSAPLELDASMLPAASLSDLRRSDHAAYWMAGYPAMMITDTANFRNTHYHCQEGQDTADRLDHDAAIRVVHATAVATAAMLASTGSAAVAGYTLPCAFDKAGVATNAGCKAGEKCSAISGEVFGPACATQHGEKKAGEVCTRPDNKTGFDDCGPGLFCTFWGEAESNPPTRVCIPICASDADCEGGTRCALLTRTAYSYSMSPPVGGICMTTCDPFGSDCKTGTQCTRLNLATDTRKVLYTCHYPGEGKAGDKCDAIAFGQCSPGLDCLPGPNEIGAKCTPACDQAHPCDGGKTCVPDGYADKAGTGHCR
ncbi:MAG: M28 family peptidase [Deltaproteobacteria bacterium]|nr:M28 family peptidase [Deltaproteobacteria bacterium]